MTKIVAISDIHGSHDDITLPKGDILVVAGDFTNMGRDNEIIGFNEWLGEQDFDDILVVPGNHDFLFQTHQALARQLLNNATVLIDEEYTAHGIKFYGSPWTPEFYNWAFMKKRGDLHTMWELVPDDIDFLITHGPPAGILDKVAPGRYAGCQELTDELLRITPKVHVFGHLHLEGGQQLLKNGTMYANVAICDDQYNPTRKPFEINL